MLQESFNLLLQDNSNTLPMHTNTYITPYISPPVEEDLSAILKKIGRKIQLKKREYILRKSVINSFIYVESGLLGRIRETPLQLKQTYLDLIPPQRVANFINFFSPGKVHISILSLRNSEVYMAPFEEIYKIMAQNFSISQKFEEMYGANAETLIRSSHCNFIFPCEYRLLSLFKAMVRHSQLKPDADGWILLPYKLTREEYCQIIFSSLLTLDKILLHWKKELLYKKNKEGSFVHQNLLKKSIMESLSKEHGVGQTIHTKHGLIHKV